jgi:virginiamycin B lyase
VTFSEFPVPTPNGSPAGIVVAHGIGPAVYTELEANKIGTGSLEFPVPTPGSGPTAIVSVGQPTLTTIHYWFVESRVSRIGRFEYNLAGTGSFLPDIVIPTAAAGLRGIAAEGLNSAAWFSEFDANKIGRAGDGPVTEFSVPTAQSGPWGVAVSGSIVWFTEFKANAIGRFDPATGIFQEFPLPTAGAGPTEIAAASDSVWFIESTAGKIGMITRAGAITEYPLPDSASEPAGITADPSGGVWFTERARGRVGRAKPDGSLIEYALPSADSGPTAIAFKFQFFGGPPQLFVAETDGNRIAIATADHYVIVAAGRSGPWTTVLDIANPESFDQEVVVSTLGAFPSDCIFAGCFQFRQTVLVKARSTAQLTLPRGPQQDFTTWYVSPPGFDPPTVRARIVNTANPGQSADLPVLRGSTIKGLNPVVLSFAGATKSAGGGRSNLVLADASSTPGGTARGTIEVLDREGNLVGTTAFDLSQASSLFLGDIVGLVGGSGLENGQVRVRKTGGTALLWGVLATARDDGSLSISTGLNP